MTTAGKVFSIALCAIAFHLANGSVLVRSRGLYAQEAAQASVARRIGAIKALNGSTISLTVDSGSDVTVEVVATTRIVRIAPGEKSLKNATPALLSDLQIGDRILVGGKASEDAKSLIASSIVVMKRSDVEAHKEEQRKDWQRGLGGVVSVVDPAAGTVTISTSGFGGTKTTLVRTSKSTIVRRYAPDSVKFDDAKSSTLQEIHPGDQLRARGNRSPDAVELAADEIVSGTFHNVAGVVNSVDASAGSILVQDVLSKKLVQVRVSAESQLRKLPPELAQHIAMRLKGATAGQSSNSGASSSGLAASELGGGMRPASGVGAGTGMGNGMRSGAAPDFQQMLSHMPALAVSDLHKGDVVMMVTTEGTPSTGGTAITLLSGVEAILQAAPGGNQAMMLTPWTLEVPSGDAGNQ